MKVNENSDRLGGAKADRRKEVAISSAVSRFIETKTTEKDPGQMSRGKMVLFFKHAFPDFLSVVVSVVKDQPKFAFNSVFSPTSKIRQIDWIITKSLKIPKKRG